MERTVVAKNWREDQDQPEEERNQMKTKTKMRNENEKWKWEMKNSDRSLPTRRGEIVQVLR